MPRRPGSAPRGGEGVVVNVRNAERRTSWRARATSATYVGKCAELLFCGAEHLVFVLDERDTIHRDRGELARCSVRVVGLSQGYSHSSGIYSVLSQKGGKTRTIGDCNSPHAAAPVGVAEPVVTWDWRGIPLDIQTFRWRLLYTPNPSEARAVGGNWSCAKYGLHLRWFIPAVKPFTPLADMFYEPRYGGLLRVAIYGEMNLLVKVSRYWRDAWSIISPSAISTFQTIIRERE